MNARKVVVNHLRTLREGSSAELAQEIDRAIALVEGFPPKLDNPPQVGDVVIDPEGVSWAFRLCPDGLFGWVRLEAGRWIRGDGASWTTKAWDEA